MSMKLKKSLRKVQGAGIIFIGFILSPLSWWNDIIVNIPLAYLFALPFGAINESIFTPMMIFFYWCTNILGFVMMHYGSRKLLKKQKRNKSSKKEIIKTLIITTIYTILIVALVYFKILKFPTGYFNKNG